MKPLFVVKYLIILILFSGTACEEVLVDQQLRTGKEFTFQIDKTYTSEDGNFSLKITDIGDSRCQEGVVCVWQGEVTVKGELTENNSKSTFELHSVVNDQQKQPEGYTIKLIDAKPYPKYGDDSRPEDLLVTLLIQKN
jgi:hypothetical protein